MKLPPGDGPRHFAFHPNGRWFYSLQEEASTLVLFDYDATSGTSDRETDDVNVCRRFLPAPISRQKCWSRRDGQIRLCGQPAARQHRVVLHRGGRARLTFAGEEWTRGDYPRSFSLDPTGNFLYSCNQSSDAIACFRVNRQSGSLTFTGQYTPVGTPAMILFLTKRTGTDL